MSRGLGDVYKRQRIGHEKILLSLIVTLCRIYTLTQSSAVKIGEAVIRCNNFSFAKAMLLNARLSVIKSSKQNNANTVVSSNALIHYY